MDESPGRSLPLDRATSAPVERPTPAEQRAAWTAALGDPAAASVLAAQFSLGLGEIQDVAARVCGDGGDGTEGGLPAPVGRLWAECRRRTRPAIEALAQPIDAKATFDDIVLPPAETALLQRITGQVAARSPRVRRMGLPRAHEPRARHQRAVRGRERHRQDAWPPRSSPTTLALDLYRIDLSAVVSKYIGETEKNLRRAVRRRGGRAARSCSSTRPTRCSASAARSRTAHDRYANIEVNYLLQRMESYRGLAILATNMKSALDAGLHAPAALRRRLPVPGARGTARAVAQGPAARRAAASRWTSTAWRGCT
ncbi:MAG: ATP-binding protein [Desulfobacterales bacterium]|nr:ATP-binding protein [Desulfobacterales bacterium]